MASSVLRSQISLGGICDEESTKTCCKTDRNGILDQVEVAPIIDAYKGMSTGFNSSKSDIDTYLRILD